MSRRRTRRPRSRRASGRPQPSPPAAGSKAEAQPGRAQAPEKKEGASRSRRSRRRRGGRSAPESPATKPAPPAGSKVEAQPGRAQAPEKKEGASRSRRSRRRRGGRSAAESPATKPAPPAGSKAAAQAGRAQAPEKKEGASRSRRSRRRRGGRSAAETPATKPAPPAARAPARGAREAAERRPAGRGPRRGGARRAAVPREAPPRFRVPAEFEPHAATWIAWPHHAPDWPGKLSAVQWAYVEILRLLARSEPVHVLVKDAAMRAEARGMLAQTHVDETGITFHLVPTNRSWIRDYGPIFALHGRSPVMLDWRFNAWARYSNWRLDDGVNAKLAGVLGFERISPAAGGKPVVLEGGSIELNGRGILITTEECQLSEVQARNPSLSKADLEKVFREFLGVKQILWLGRGIAGDDTHGHVDDIARFVDERTIVAAREGNRRDENHAPLEENLARLRAARDPRGRPFRVVTLPMPEPIRYEGARLPASYANFYIGNRVVLVPTFNDRSDLLALDTLGRLFPDREVIGVHSVDLILGLGALHCLTLHQGVGSQIATDRKA